MKFRAAVSVANTAGPTLPLIHGTSQIRLNLIAQHRKLTPRPCKVFNQDLLYFSYGRFSYRVAAKNTGHPGYGAGPCVLILDSSAMSAISNVFPFDTGAFDHYRLGPINPDAELEDFRCENSFQYCNSLISQIWVDRKHYILFDVASGLRPAPASNPRNNLYMEMYQALVSGQGTKGIDDRRGTIEISTQNEVPIDSDKVLGLVLPWQTLQDPDIQALIARSKSMIIKGYYYRGDAPREYHRLVEDHTHQILEELNFV